jgi:hypothetical protein
MPAQRTGVTAILGELASDQTTGRTCNSLRISNEPFFYIYPVSGYMNILIKIFIYSYGEDERIGYPMESFRSDLWTTDSSESESRSNVGRQNEAIRYFGAKEKGIRIGVVRCGRTFLGQKQAEEVKRTNSDKHRSTGKTDSGIHSGAVDDAPLHNQTSTTLPYTTHATLH